MNLSVQYFPSQNPPLVPTQSADAVSKKNDNLMETDPPKTDGNPISDLAALFMAFFKDANAQVRKITDEMNGRTSITNDFNVIENALDRVKLKSPPYGLSEFDVVLQLDEGSPAKAALLGQSPAQKITLWSVLGHYGFPKGENISRPASAQELADLINGVKEKHSGLTSMDQETNVRLNQIRASRDIDLEWAKSLTMDELKLMLAMLRTM